MAGYTLIFGSSNVVRDVDGAIIPADPKNSDWQTYQMWLATGRTPNSAINAVVPSPAIAVIADSARSRACADVKALIAQGRTADAVTALLKLME